MLINELAVLFAMADLSVGELGRGGIDLLPGAGRVRALSLLVPTAVIGLVALPLIDRTLRRVITPTEPVDGDGVDPDDVAEQEVRAGGRHGWSDDDLIDDALLVE